MDNFKRSRPNPKKSSVDGLIGGAPKRLKRSSRQFEQGRSPRGMIGDFRRSDGFHKNTPTPAVQDQRSRKSLRGRDDQRGRKSAQARQEQERKHEHRQSRHLFRKAVSTMAIILLVGGGYLFGKAYLNILNVFRGGGNALALEENIHPSQLKGEGDGRVNVLLLGRGGEGHDGTDLTDTIIVASIDPVNKKAALLGIPRDLYVQPEGYGAMKINSVFFTGKNYDVQDNEQPDDAGMRLLEETVEDTMGVPIHYNVLVDFEGFKQAVNTVGGVSADVPEELAVTDYMHYFGVPYTLDVGSGQQYFDGMRALMFSRTRKTSPRGDFDRSERQRLVMVALKDKVFSVGTYSNPVKVNQLLSDLGNHVSSNFTTSEILRVYEIMKEIPNDQIASLGLADEDNPLVTTANIGGLSVVVPVAGTYDFSAIQYYVRNALRDGFLEKEDATVDVYNATFITGLAGRTADELESFGYNVATVDNAPNQDRAMTIIIDQSNGEKEYTRAYLENRFGVEVIDSIPSDINITPSQSDFVIILGKNEESRLQN